MQRYVQPWRFHWRRSRCLLALAVISAVLYAVRYGYRMGYFSLGQDPLWSYPYINASATTFPPHDPAYVIFEPPSSLPPANEPLEKVGQLPSECIDGSFAAGQRCHLRPDPPLDVVWTWANGSDGLFRHSIAKNLRTTHPRWVALSLANSQFFRDHDELRHSVRSVLQHFGAYTTQLHIVTSDFPMPVPVMDGDSPYRKPRRLGLVPRWLDPRRAGTWQDGDVRLMLKYHSEIFQPYGGASFNSYGIEAQLANMQGISDNFIYMNDDFFMMANLSASDFYTSAYGTVLRMQADLLVNSSSAPQVPVGGEWGPLEYTNWCLSKRFGARKRPYTTHTAKSVSMGVMKELSRMWHAELAVTASHAFRGMHEGHSDVYLMFLFSHFLVERWREGLLWSWAVGKIGGLDDQWGPPEKARAWGDLGGRSGARVVRVVTTARTTMDEAVVRGNLHAAGHVMSGKTRYAFASGDGYPYDYRNGEGAAVWPSFASPGDLICELDYQECFDHADMASASAFFKVIAFDKNRQCGDCIIHALRAASGAAGLAAFLPEHGRTYMEGRRDNEHNSRNDRYIDEPPHLPLVSDWTRGDFALRDVIISDAEVDIREWTLRMLERYRFVIGHTPILFHQIPSATAARTKLKKVDEDKDVALLCLNDNIRGLSRKADQVLLAWQEQRWGHKAAWEH